MWFGEKVIVGLRTTFGLRSSLFFSDHKPQRSEIEGGIKGRIVKQLRQL